MTEKIRVLLVDDHALFRGGVKALLQRYPEFEVVDETGAGRQCIQVSDQRGSLLPGHSTVQNKRHRFQPIE